MGPQALIGSKRTKERHTQNAATWAHSADRLTLKHSAEMTDEFVNPNVQWLESLLTASDKQQKKNFLSFLDEGSQAAASPAKSHAWLNSLLGLPLQADKTCSARTEQFQLPAAVIQDGTVSEETQHSIKTGLVRSQLNGTISEEIQGSIKAGLVRTPHSQTERSEEQTAPNGAHASNLLDSGYQLREAEDSQRKQQEEESRRRNEHDAEEERQRHHMLAEAREKWEAEERQRKQQEGESRRRSEVDPVAVSLHEELEDAQRCTAMVMEAWKSSEASCRQAFDEKRLVELREEASKHELTAVLRQYKEAVATQQSLQNRLGSTHTLVVSHAATIGLALPGGSYPDRPREAVLLQQVLEFHQHAADRFDNSQQEYTQLFARAKQQIEVLQAQRDKAADTLAGRVPHKRFLLLRGLQQWQLITFRQSVVKQVHAARIGEYI